MCLNKTLPITKYPTNAVSKCHIASVGNFISIAWLLTWCTRNLGLSNQVTFLQRSTVQTQYSWFHWLRAIVYSYQIIGYTGSHTKGCDELCDVTHNPGQHCCTCWWFVTLLSCNNCEQHVTPFVSLLYQRVADDTWLDSD